MSTGYVYLIGSRNFGWYKIGKSIHPNIRVKNIGVLLPFAVEVRAVWESKWYGELESKLHRDWAHRRIADSEWFKLNETEIQQIIQSRPETILPITAKFKLKQDCPEDKKLIIRVVGSDKPKYRIPGLIKTLVQNGPRMSNKRKRKLFGYLLHELSRQSVT